MCLVARREVPGKGHGLTVRIQDGARDIPLPGRDGIVVVNHWRPGGVSEVVRVFVAAHEVHASRGVGIYHWMC